MHKLKQRLDKRKFLVALPGLLIIFLAVTLIRLQPTFFTDEYEPKVTNKIASVRTNLNQQLQPLGISFEQPSPVKCGWEPDPELRLFDCSSSAIVSSSANKIEDAAQVFQAIAKVDKILKDNGWQVYGNDYRLEGVTGSDELLLQSGINISYSNDFYDKSTRAVFCSFEAPITTYTYKPNHLDPPLSLDCSVEDSFFWLQTPRSAQGGG